MSHGHHQHTTAVGEAPDQWHTHTAAEHVQTAHGENIKHLPVAIFGVGGFLIIAATVIATVVYFNNTRDRLFAERVEQESRVQDVSLGEHDKVLNVEQKTYGLGGWVTPTSATYRMPLADARPRVIADYSPANRTPITPKPATPAAATPAAPAAPAPK